MGRLGLMILNAVVVDARWNRELKTVLVDCACPRCDKEYKLVDVKDHFIECSCGLLLRLDAI